MIKSNIPGVLLNDNRGTHELDFKISLYYLFRQCLLIKISLALYKQCIQYQSPKRHAEI